MRTMMLSAAILGLTWPFSIAAAHPPSSYSTLVVEYVEEQDRSIGTVVISTSKEEGEWYKKNLFEESSWDLVDVFVIPKSTLDGITRQPLLKRELWRATRDEEVPHSPINVRFVVGIGQDHKEIMLNEFQSAMILRDIVSRIGSYPELEGQIREILYVLPVSGK